MPENLLPAHFVPYLTEFKKDQEGKKLEEIIDFYKKKLNTETLFQIEQITPFKATGGMTGKKLYALTKTTFPSYFQTVLQLFANIHKIPFNLTIGSSEKQGIVPTLFSEVPKHARLITEKGLSLVAPASEMGKPSVNHDTFIKKIFEIEEVQSMPPFIDILLLLDALVIKACPEKCIENCPLDVYLVKQHHTFLYHLNLASVGTLDRDNKTVKKEIQAAQNALHSTIQTLREIEPSLVRFYNPISFWIEQFTQLASIESQEMQVLLLLDKGTLSSYFTNANAYLDENHTLINQWIAGQIKMVCTFLKGDLHEFHPFKARRDAILHQLSIQIFFHDWAGSYAYIRKLKEELEKYLNDTSQPLAAPNKVFDVKCLTFSSRDVKSLETHKLARLEIVLAFCLSLVDQLVTFNKPLRLISYENLKILEPAFNELKTFAKQVSTPQLQLITSWADHLKSEFGLTVFDNLKQLNEEWGYFKALLDKLSQSKSLQRLVIAKNIFSTTNDAPNFFKFYSEAIAEIKPELPLFSEHLANMNALIAQVQAQCLLIHSDASYPHLSNEELLGQFTLMNGRLNELLLPLVEFLNALQKTFQVDPSLQQILSQDTKKFVFSFQAENVEVYLFTTDASLDLLHN